MKDKLAYFFRMRRQSDTIKLICIFVLAGMVCFANVVYHIWEIYCDVNTPAEYVLTGEGRISEKRIDEMRQNVAAAKVSRQMECPVSVVYGGSKAATSCTLISEEYLEEMFQTDLSAGTPKIYINKTAYIHLKEQLQENNQEMTEMENGERDDVTELNIRYCVEGEEAAGKEGAAKKYRSAKLIVVGDAGEEEEGFVYTAETDNRLQKEADSLRVQFLKHDLDGLQVGALRRLGFAIQNEEAVIAEEYELKMQQLHIQYSLFSCVLCVVAAIGLGMKKDWRLWKA